MTIRHHIAMAAASAAAIALPTGCSTPRQAQPDATAIVLGTSAKFQPGDTLYLPANNAAPGTVRPGTSDRDANLTTEANLQSRIVGSSIPGKPAGNPAGQSVSNPTGQHPATPVKAVAKAVVYRMTGPYANNVAVALTADGKQLLSYPDPTDLGPHSAPIDLGDGWYLSRCGITPTSVFTGYTYSEYRSLPLAPTPSELLKAVIPGAAVAELRTLPISLSRALADTAAVARMIRQ